MVELKADQILHVRTFLSVTTGIVVLFAGKALNRRVRLLRDYNVPEPVTGGLLFAIAIWLQSFATGHSVEFDLRARDMLLVYFFTTIGINARVKDLVAGGAPLLKLLLCVVALLPLQDAVGTAVARLLGLPVVVGVLAGSVSLAGGHGTAIAWGPALGAKGGVGNAVEIAVVCATVGLILSSLAGGPMAHFLITRYRLESPKGEASDVGVRYDEPEPVVDYFSILRAILAIHVCAALGVLAHDALADAGITLPLFVPCLVAGLLLTNTLPYLLPSVPWPMRSPALAVVAEISLGVFLAMSLMSMQFTTLAQMAGPLFVLLGAQLMLAVLFAGLIVFPLLGRNYDAMVVCAGFFGIALGATPTAMANMTAVTQRHGPSHVAFLIVPLVGAFFVDLLNTAVIRGFMVLL